MSDDTYILSAVDIMSMKGSMKTHFLNKNARRMQKSLGQATGLTEIDFSIVEVAPGDESTEHHLHYHEEECWYVLEGQATARIGAGSHEVKAGDFVGCRKGGLAHSFKNTGTSTFKCISVSQRTNHDVSDYPRRGKRMFRNKNLTFNVVDLTVIDRPFGATK